MSKIKIPGQFVTRNKFLFMTKFVIVNKYLPYNAIISSLFIFLKNEMVRVQAAEAIL